MGFAPHCGAQPTAIHIGPLWGQQRTNLLVQQETCGTRSALSKEGASSSDFSRSVYFEYRRTTSEMGNPTQSIWIVKPVATALSGYEGLKAMAESGNTMKFMNR